MKDLWDVWLVDYATYEEIDKRGHIDPIKVASRLSYDVAAKLVKEAAFGHCMKQAEVK